MRLKLFLILPVALAFVSAFKVAPGIKHNIQSTATFRIQGTAIDTTIVVWREGKPLRYYQYIKYLKTGKYTISSHLAFKDGNLEEWRKELMPLSAKEIKRLPMDAASITKRIKALFAKPVLYPLSQVDTTISVCNGKRPLRFYQYLPLLLTGKYIVRQDSGRKYLEELTGMGLNFFTRDSVTINNNIVKGLNKADKIIVEKAKRRRYIERNGKRLFDFPINLGKSPVGHKIKEGDGRTPEGLYYLDYNVNVDASYHLGFHISYPNADDIARAKKQGVKPGGDIMIHGTSPARAKLKDWTNGCIAVANGHLDTIMKYQYRTIPIEIRK